MIQEYDVRFAMKFPRYNAIKHLLSKPIGKCPLLDPTSLTNPSTRHGPRIAFLPMCRLFEEAKMDVVKDSLAF